MFARTLAATAAALGFMATSAFAEPTVMTDEQLDTVVAGNINVVTRSGNVVWTVTDLGTLQGFNRGSKGKTDKAGPALAGPAQAGLGLSFD